MAVPHWKFSELDEAMQELQDAAEDVDGPTPWLTMFKEGLSDWYCIKHDLLPGDCTACREVTFGGWHQGRTAAVASGNNHKRFCNAHSQAVCTTCPKDTEVSSG